MLEGYVDLLMKYFVSESQSRFMDAEIRPDQAKCFEAVCGSLIWLSRIAGLLAYCGLLCGFDCVVFLNTNWELRYCDFD